MGLRTFEAGRVPQRPGTSLHFLFNVGRVQIASCQGCHLFGHLPLLQSNSLHPTWDVKSEIRKLQIFVFGMSFIPYSSVCALRIGGQSDKCVEDPSNGFKATRDAGDLCRFVDRLLESRANADNQTRFSLPMPFPLDDGFVGWIICPDSPINIPLSRIRNIHPGRWKECWRGSRGSCCLP